MRDEAINSRQKDDSRNNYIDAHVHVWTTDFDRYPLAPGFTPLQMNPSRFTPDDLLAHSAPLGVVRTVLIQMVFYGHDNSYMLECIERYAGVFAGVGLVDETGLEPAGEMRRLKRLGVRGIRIVPPERGSATWLNGNSMRRMWTCGADEKIALCCLVDPEDLPAIDQTCRRFPETLVVIDHCARIGGDGLFRPADVERLCRLAEHPNVYVKVSAFYFLGAKAPPYTDIVPLIRRLVSAYGAERLMWASDYPFQVMAPHTYAASLELVRDRLDVSSEKRDWLVRRTAEKVFFS